MRVVVVMCMYMYVHACAVHYILANGTLDDVLWPMISKKLEVGLDTCMHFDMRVHAV